MCSVPEFFNCGAFEWTVHVGEIMWKIKRDTEEDFTAHRCRSRELHQISGMWHTRAAVIPWFASLQKWPRRKALKVRHPDSKIKRFWTALIIRRI
jgi:hypothetical protein